MATTHTAHSTFSRRQSLTLALGAGGAALLYGSGLIGAGAALAATNKPVGGVGVRICKRPGGSSARVRAVASDAGGRFTLTVSEAGDQDVDIDKAALQLAVNAEAAATPVGAAERIVVVRFAPRLRVSGPGGQTAIPGQPGTFILSSGVQTFVVAGMAAGSVIAGSIETADAGDLFPSMAAKGIKDPAVKGCGSCGITGRMIPRNDINPLPRPRASGL